MLIFHDSSVFHHIRGSNARNLAYILEMLTLNKFLDTSVLTKHVGSIGDVLLILLENLRLDSYWFQLEADRRGPRSPKAFVVCLACVGGTHLALSPVPPQPCTAAWSHWSLLGLRLCKQPRPGLLSRGNFEQPTETRDPTEQFLLDFCALNG